MINPYKGIAPLVKTRTSNAAFAEFQEGIVEVLEEHMKALEIRTWDELADMAKIYKDGDSLRCMILGDPSVPMALLFSLFEAVGQSPRILAAPRNDVANA